VISGFTDVHNCNLGQNVVYQSSVQNRDRGVERFRITSPVSGVELEDDVFCGPSMVFTTNQPTQPRHTQNTTTKRTLSKQALRSSQRQPLSAESRWAVLFVAAWRVGHPRRTRRRPGMAFPAVSLAGCASAEFVCQTLARLIRQ